MAKHRKRLPPAEGRVAFSLKEQSFLAEGADRQHILTLVAALIFYRLGLLAVGTLLVWAGFKYGTPSLFVGLALIGKYS